MVKLRVHLNHCFLKWMWWSNFESSWIIAFSSSCDGQISCLVESLLSQVRVMSNFVSSWITAFSSACDVQTKCPVDGQTTCPVESLLSQVPLMVRLRLQLNQCFLKCLWCWWSNLLMLMVKLVQLMVKLPVQLNHCFLKCLWWFNLVSSWITTFSSACHGQTMCPFDGQT